METLTLFNIPFALVYVMPFIGAGALGWAGYLLGQRYTPNFGGRSRTSRIENFAGGASLDKKPNSAVVGSFEHKVRIAFARFNIDAAGNEDYYLNLGRLVAGIALSLILMVIGLPFITSLVGLLAGRVFINGWITRSWNKTRTEMEAELPSLLLRLNGTLQVSQNVPSALEETARTLRSDGPLRAWAMETAARMHAEGHGSIESIRQNAAGMSMSLSIAAELIGRMWTTGGKGYGEAFGAAADNLESVLDARVLARSKGGSAQGTVNILTVMTFGMIAFMTRSPAMGDIVNTPLVAVLNAVIALVIVYGHSQVSDIIDNAV